MSDWVVRGGIAAPASLKKGYKRYRAIPGLFGFSVQYGPGMTVDQLALSGQLPHPMISYAAAADLVKAGQAVGFGIELVNSPGDGCHHTLTARDSVTGAILPALPDALAIALSGAFMQMTNPHRVP